MAVKPVEQAEVVSSSPDWIQSEPGSRCPGRFRSRGHWVLGFLGKRPKWEEVIDVQLSWEGA